MIHIIRATKDHAHSLFPRLREAERRSIAKFDIDPMPVLEGLLKKGPVFTALVDGVPACMWGLECSTLIGGTPKMWMLTTPLVEDHHIKFLRLSRWFVYWARENYGPLDGAVDEENVISERWLHWIGFRPSGQVGHVKLMRYA